MNYHENSVFFMVGEEGEGDLIVDTRALLTA